MKYYNKQTKRAAHLVAENTRTKTVILKFEDNEKTVSIAHSTLLRNWMPIETTNEKEN